MNWSALRLSDPTLPVWVSAALLLVFLMLFPLAAIFRTSLWDENGFSLSRYVEVFTKREYVKLVHISQYSGWCGEKARERASEMRRAVVTPS